MLEAAMRLDRELGMRKPSKPLPEVPEAKLLAMGGKKWQGKIIFGPMVNVEGMRLPVGTNLTFTAYKNGWKVGLVGKPSREEFRRELAKSNRGLWDESNETPAIAFKAIEDLLYCVQAFSAMPLSEDQANAMQCAVLATLKALTAGDGRKLQVAFDILTGEPLESNVATLQEQCLVLSVEYQRPPTKAELKALHDPNVRIQPAQFAVLLAHAGLSWLAKTSPVRRT